MTDQTQKMADALDAMKVSFTVTASMKPPRWEPKPALPHHKIRNTDDYSPKARERANAGGRMFSWLVVFERPGEVLEGPRVWAFDYWTGAGLLTRKVGWTVPAEPSALDVLACVASDVSSADQDLTSWAEDFGMSDDVGRAVETYDAVQRETREFRAFFSHVEQETVTKLCEDW